MELNTSTILIPYWNATKTNKKNCFQVTDTQGQGKQKERGNDNKICKLEGKLMNGK